ncbi:hypothetical protein chiPu_0022058 [Chiloscyllium punctatum]|uniref:Uncharacterized protein n=1 Tax=Chiloscyllium punctatum TaxID=137246 RepID=A0A401RIS1_CHIPU|nr:hypothetical protein [Chiloscyllium punctatum]
MELEDEGSAPRDKAAAAAEAAEAAAAAAAKSTRLDMSHGFVRHIRRNQIAREDGRDDVLLVIDSRLCQQGDAAYANGKEAPLGPTNRGAEGAGRPAACDGLTGIPANGEAPSPLIDSGLANGKEEGRGK